ncbi:MAG TPA: hypothetical protein VHV58_09495 [Pseudolabrys sp.]|jgi:hypothetical protein|nr:hypothetical protein [Pseudolabrys sp.]
MALDDGLSTVSWRSVLAGTIASLAITLILVAFGIGVGFSVVSPWSGSGVSAPTATLAAGIYLIVVAMLSSTVGGYIAGRTRAQWRTVHTDERYFRDTAHGFLVWALATVVSAAVLGGATTNLISGASAGLIPAAGSAARSSPMSPYIDSMLRTDPAAATPATSATSNTDMSATRNEIGRVLRPGLAKGGSVSQADRGYLVKVVSARTGLSQADAEQRVDQTVTQAKAAADQARKTAAKLSLWLAASMLAGALAASLAAVEGGILRNQEWYLRRR